MSIQKLLIGTLLSTLALAVYAGDSWDTKEYQGDVVYTLDRTVVVSGRGVGLTSTLWLMDSNVLISIDEKPPRSFPVTRIDRNVVLINNSLALADEISKAKKLSITYGACQIANQCLLSKSGSETVSKSWDIDKALR